MPTYEYECRTCGKTFELFQSISASPRRTCSCGKKGKVRRLLGTGAGFLFKGSGFYTTDYRSESYKKAVQAESKTGSADAGTGAAAAKKDGAGATAGKSDAGKKDA